MAISPLGAVHGDPEVVARIRAGRIEEFAVLFGRHHAPLVHYLRYRTGDPELAADIAQESFLIAFRDLSRLTDAGAFRPWVYGIARNLVAMAYRRRRLRRFLSLDWLLVTAPDSIPAEPAANAITRADEREDITATLSCLSASLSEALLLHAVAGFTAPEVARITGISVAAAERRISRAKLAFRRHYVAVNRADAP